MRCGCRNTWTTGFAASYTTVCRTEAGETSSDVAALGLRNVTMTGNTAAAGSGGGAFITSTPGYEALRRVVVTVAPEEGAPGGQSLQLGSNEAALAGGGAYIAGNISLSMTAALLAGNSAGRGGGGMYIGNTTTPATITGTVVSGNLAAAGNVRCCSRARLPRLSARTRASSAAS